MDEEEEKESEKTKKECREEGSERTCWTTDNNE